MRERIPAPVSFVIVNFNGARFLTGCIDSILRQTFPPAEVIVVDNGSTDASLEILAEKYPQVLINALGKNYGLTHAYNVGMQTSKFDWVVLANNDIILDDHCLENLIRAATSSAVITTPRFLSMRSPHSDQNFPVRFVPSLKHPWSSLRKGLTSTGNVVTDIAGFGLLLVNRMTVGLIDERFPLYFGEDDFSLKCRRRGLTVLLVQNSKVYHYGSGTIGKLSIRKIRQFMQGWLSYRAKWFPVWSLLPSMIFASVLQAYQHLAPARHATSIHPEAALVDQTVEPAHLRED